MSSQPVLPTRPSQRLLRHPAEVPFFVVMVVVNVLIVAAILEAAWVLPFLPESLKQTQPVAEVAPVHGPAPRTAVRHRAVPGRHPRSRGVCRERSRWHDGCRDMTHATHASEEGGAMTGPRPGRRIGLRAPPLFPDLARPGAGR
jgi:hypothetical protein